MQQNKAQLKVQACQQAATELKGHASQEGAAQNGRRQSQLTSQSKGKAPGGSGHHLDILLTAPAVVANPQL